MWFYKTADGQEIGPVSGMDMVGLIEGGQLVETTPVRRDGETLWSEAWQTDRAGYLRHHDRQANYTRQIMPAAIWRRVVAYLIDIMIGSTLSTGLFIVFFTGMDVLPNTGLFDNLLVIIAVIILVPLVIFVLYFTLPISGRHQAPWGMRIMKMHVARYNGSRISFSRALGRTLFFLISFSWVIPIVVALFNQERLTLHDMITGTRVVQGRAER